MLNYILLNLHDSISNWAVSFGDELWELAETMTKAKEIKQVKEYGISSGMAMSK